MIKTETMNISKIFKVDALTKSDISCIGTYEQYKIYDSTNVAQSDAKVIKIFPLSLSENWSIEGIYEDCQIEDSVISDQDVNGWIGYIKESFYEIQHVESVYYQVDKDKIDVWIMIPDRNLSLLRKLIDVEMKILDQFETANESLYIFEFHIIYRCGAIETNLIPREAMRLIK